MNNLSCIKLRLEQGILAIGAFEMLSKDVRSISMITCSCATWEWD
jgi:hypothetical protein